MQTLILAHRILCSHFTWSQDNPWALRLPWHCALKWINYTSTCTSKQIAVYREILCTHLMYSIHIARRLQMPLFSLIPTSGVIKALPFKDLCWNLADKNFSCGVLKLNSFCREHALLIGKWSTLSIQLYVKTVTSENWGSKP